MWEPGPCAALAGAGWNAPASPVTVNGTRHTLSLTWSSDVELVASALLLVALRVAGRRARLLPAAPALCARCRHTAEPALCVALAAQDPAGGQCALKTGNMFWHSIMRGSSVPGSTGVLYRRDMLPSSECPPDIDRLPFCSNNSQGERSFKEVFVSEQYWAQNETISDISVEKTKRLTRQKLIERVTNASESFRFVDADIWKDEARVVPECRLHAAAARAVDAKLRRYAPDVYDAVAAFDPTPLELRQVLELNSTHRDTVHAACEWAAKHNERFEKWSRGIRHNHWAVFYFCETGRSRDEYRSWIEYVGEEIERRGKSREKAYGVTLFKDSIDCDDRHMLNARLRSIPAEHLNLLIGAVGVGRGVELAAEYAEQQELPLLAYDVTTARAAGALAGRARHAARALRSLLAACGWRRLALLSEESSLARALAAELGDGSGPGAAPRVRDVPLPADDARLRRELRALADARARVFLVNAGAAAAADVLAVATDMGLTAAAGYVWLVRERPVQNSATHTFGEYLTMSFSRSWPVSPRAGETAERAERPPHAATIVDALLALDEGFARLLRTNPNRSIYDTHAVGDLRSFWNLLESEPVSGIEWNLTFRNRELIEPPIFLERWNGSEIMKYKLWSENDKCPLHPAPSDGEDCYFRSGDDSFAESCLDRVILTTVLILAALVPGAIWGSMTARRFVRRRIERIERKAIEKIRIAASQLEPYFVERSALELREELGAGQAGRVWLGMLRAAGREARAVAVKALHEHAAPADETDFFREAHALAALQHERVVRFVGVCVKDGPPLLLMEYAFYGDLLSYLCARRHLAAAADSATGEDEARHVSAEALTRLAREAAEALDYLERSGFVHRDVRAANCLVDERRALKLGDFGMARRTGGDGEASDGEYLCRRRGLFPVLWMAPESVTRGVYSAASDVWSLGVLALELVTLGARPYGALGVRGVWRLVAAGGRPPLPRDAAAGTRALALACWRREAGARPAARALAAWLAAHPRALRPALQPPADLTADADSGIGEPATPATPATPPLSASLDTIHIMQI